MFLFLLIFVIVISLVQAYTLSHGLDHVSYDTFPTKSTVDPDESFEVVTRITNAKLMPVSYLKLQESLPLEMVPEGDVSIRRDNELARMTTTTFLKPKQRLERRFTASLPNRGRFFLRGATLLAGDFLGLKQSVGYYPISREIVVLPRPLPEATFGQTLGDFMGNMSVNRFIMEDPVLTLGFREYTGREPQRAISWTQSARMGRTMVKNYDHTLDLSVTVILNIECPKDMPNTYPLIEDAFSAARTVCEKLEDKKIKYGIITNATSAGAIGLWSQISDGLGRKHLMSILEGLGRATYNVTFPFATIVNRAIRRDEAGRYYIVITPTLDGKMAQELHRLNSLKGGKAFIIDVSKLAKKEAQS